MTLCLLVHACDTGSGGAVELSWTLRPASSALTMPFVDCQDDTGTAGWGPVQWIRLDWQVGTTTGTHHWRCNDHHGATGFELDEGVAQLSIVPECATDQVAAQDTYIAPAIVQRKAIRGETVSLGAVELVVSVAKCKTATSSDNLGDQSCICGTSQLSN